MARKDRGNRGPTPEELGIKVDLERLKVKEQATQERLNQNSQVIVSADGGRRREPKRASDETE